MVGQPGHYLLWISIAGIDQGKPKHFKHNYLAPLMTGFHVPVMEFPLRNTKEVIKLAGLDGNNANKTAYVGFGYSMQTHPSYTLPQHLMSGVHCQQLKVKKNDDDELLKAVEAGCRVMMERTAGSGFPILFDFKVDKSTVVSAVYKAVGQSALLYKEKNDARRSAEVENWLRRWKRHEETRVLVTDDQISRGWEAPATMVIASSRTENLVMRTSVFCLLIKIE